ncbi:MAG: hypothetical protein ABI537_07755 [Casimicrobiaceae bacterium]
MGAFIGLALALLVASLTRTRFWHLWLAFAVTFVASLLVYAGLDSHGLRMLFSLRQPAAFDLLVGALVGFWLGARPASAPGTN